LTGIHPGEKLFEELWLEEENASCTRHPRIYIGRKEEHDLLLIREQIQEPCELADCGDAGRMRVKFKEIVREYAHIPPGRSDTRQMVDVKADTKPGAVARGRRPSWGRVVGEG
jgi:FlaA1/EpsC-like NDP-sugar epimerase